MKLILIGIQGSGKSTQGNLLSKQLKIPYLSTGHIFRLLAREKTDLGRYIKETMNAGFLIPDNKVIEIVNEYLSRPEYKMGYILDGFPRTIDQVKAFKNNIDKVIYLRISDKEAIWRLFHRGDDSRADETIPAIKRRIKLFQKFTLPVLKHYEKDKKLVMIEGAQPIEKVNNEILKSLGKQLIKNQIEAWEQKKKILLAIVGLPGAGKSEAAKYFSEKNGPIIKFGQIINDYIAEHNLNQNEKNHKKIREELRKKYGQEALAFLNEKKIIEAFKKNKIIIIDGMRSWEEYLYLSKKLKEVKIVILGLYADKRLRYQRVLHRKYRNHLYGKERDMDELIGINMAPTIGFADYFIDNNSTIEDFHNRLEILYREIYYS